MQMVCYHFAVPKTQSTVLPKIDASFEHLICCQSFFYHLYNTFVLTSYIAVTTLQKILINGKISGNSTWPTHYYDICFLSNFFHNMC